MAHVSYFKTKLHDFISRLNVSKTKENPRYFLTLLELHLFFFPLTWDFFVVLGK